MGDDWKRSMGVVQDNIQIALLPLFPPSHKRSHSGVLGDRKEWKSTGTKSWWQLVLPPQFHFSTHLTSFEFLNSFLN